MFETIIAEQIQGKRIVLPLSGGLDSRTQAVALQRLNADVSAYSYEFENGYAETKIAKKIAEECNFHFKSYKIDKGYLWDKIEELATITECYSDFTSPRQMAITEHFKAMGNVFSLGHWGDVLFDNMGLPQLSHNEEIKVLSNKLLKRGGMDLASTLWRTWGLKGDFKTYFYERLSKLLSEIEINNSNAKLRAFKSMYWAPRWTSVNLTVFSNYLPITLPYYDNRMCKFICTIPEKYLKGRKLQMEYIKRNNKQLAEIRWQDHRPFSVNTYNYNRFPFNTPYKITNKFKRSFNGLLGKKYIQRNWELQFLGEANDKHLKSYLFNNDLQHWIPEKIIGSIYKDFKTESTLQKAHAINMLLVLSIFNKRHNIWAKE